MVIERPKSLRDLVLDNLRRRIVSGQLAMGQALSERKISDDLQVSKTPVREALAQLREEGLVEIEPQKGAKVFTLTGDEVDQICDFRLTIELAAFKHALWNDRDALVEDMSKIVADMHEELSKGEVESYLDLDTEFHRLAFKYCGNEYLASSYERYEGKIAALRTHMAALPDHTIKSMQEHRDLLEVCRNRDLDRLQDVLKTHFNRTRDCYAQTLG
ncbi:GntR family transcriptional regulator [Labrenzia sp. PHM005]|uniref:GntR family transcriptional regulator n=1 Tax=Labrenzia sp. PHM005 TaxID=2590016 RepID=UPI00113FDA92|nr:GntR family transcriptional regulator [Labrenzia sp. PHM005]QDG75394.1 GntR family transcriptional regulator [Labrenzia sp. PHM005]